MLLKFGQMLKFGLQVAPHFLLVALLRYVDKLESRTCSVIAVDLLEFDELQWRFLLIICIFQGG